MTETRPPNVVFVLTDDQGYPPLGCHQHPFIQTPALDRFHGQASRFTQFHVGPTCAPTRSGLLTGHYANSTGVWHTIGGRSLLRDDEWTLADALGERGYATGIFGKWHLGDTPPYQPHDRGFQTAIYHGGGGVGQTMDWWGNDYFDDVYLVNGEPKRFEGYCTDVFFDEAIKFIGEKRDQPFFCYISTNAPHAPYNVEDRYWKQYEGKTDSEEAARFFGMISNIDENFGKLRAALSEMGLEENTILVFMSDNGQCGYAMRGESDYFNAGMRGVKGDPYEGGHRVPFFIRWPAGGLDGGRDIHAVTSYVDFMPTVLDLCGAAPGEGRTFHGASLAGLLRGEPAGKLESRITVTDSQRLINPIKWRRSCVLEGSYRLINGCELYDLAGDPAQERDIAADHPEVVARLREGYEQWWAIVSARAHEDIPFYLDGPGGPVIEMRCHDLRAGDDDIAWNQGRIRWGDGGVGHWEINVRVAGRYRFAARRWPAEAGYAVRAGIDGIDVPVREDAIAESAMGWYRDGEALAFRAAILRLNEQELATLPVDDDQPEVVFEVDLPQGPAALEIIFSDNDRLIRSAYYVEARGV